MEKIISKREPGKLLHIIYRQKDLATQQKRGVDITPEEMALQTRAIKAGTGDIFPAHKHRPQERATNATQESIIVMRGSVKATYYDTDDAALLTTVLTPGDIAVTFAGGHRFEILEENTLLYEHKNGPYNGYAKDKEMIPDD